MWSCERAGAVMAAARDVTSKQLENFFIRPPSGGSAVAPAAATSVQHSLAAMGNDSPAGKLDACLPRRCANE
jgi:hypothetical protein